jgi:DnaJ-class molecular chaperone
MADYYEARQKWHEDAKAKANPACPTCRGNGIVDVDDFIISMCPVYAECPGCIDPNVKTASGKPHTHIPWTPKT